MNWCNGFSTTLTVRGRSPWRRGGVRLRRSPDGRWQLQAGGRGWQRAELRAAWLAGPMAGLALRTVAGGRTAWLVLAADQPAADWRRLRVHLRVPQLK